MNSEDWGRVEQALISVTGVHSAKRMDYQNGMVTYQLTLEPRVKDQIESEELDNAAELSDEGVVPNTSETAEGLKHQIGSLDCGDVVFTRMLFENGYLHVDAGGNPY